MADETTTTPPPPEGSDTATEATTKAEESVPYERFAQANRKAKEAADAAKAAQRQIDDLKRQVEERESAGLPELERMKKQLEAAERRAEENERKAQETETKLVRSSRERLVTAAAREAGFADPTDASAFLDLDAIEDEKDAERAVKRLAQQKKHLLKSDEPKLPGKVLENGRPAAPQGTPGGSRTAAADREWAERVAPELQRLVGGWSSTSS